MGFGGWPDSGLSSSGSHSEPVAKGGDDVRRLILLRVTPAYSIENQNFDSFERRDFQQALRVIFLEDR